MTRNTDRTMTRNTDRLTARDYFYFALSILLLVAGAAWMVYVAKPNMEGVPVAWETAWVHLWGVPAYLAFIASAVIRHKAR